MHEDGKGGAGEKEGRAEEEEGNQYRGWGEGLVLSVFCRLPFWGTYRSQTAGWDEARDQQPGGHRHRGEGEGTVEQRHGTEVSTLGCAAAGMRVGKEVGEGEEGGGNGEGRADPEEDVEREGEAGWQEGEGGRVRGGSRDEGEERRGEICQSQKGGAGCRGEREWLGIDGDMPLGGGGGFGLEGDGDELLDG